MDVLGRTLGEELLEPTRIYALDCLDLMDEAEVHVFSHVTGGGLAANLARVLPGNAAVDIDRATWKPQPIFELIRELGGVERLEIEKTLNQGIGMFAVVEDWHCARVFVEPTYDSHTASASGHHRW